MSSFSGISGWGKISQQKNHDFDIIVRVGKKGQTRIVRKVVVAATLSNASWRDFLVGFFDYAKRRAEWDIRITQSMEELERALSDCHGVVTGIRPNRKVQSILAERDLPLVAVGAEWRLDGRIRSVASVRNDNEDIGRFCARCFQSRGRFASVGFVPSNPADDWSAARERGFLESFVRIEKSTFRPVAEPGSNADIAALAKWLRDLPKPSAVMAAWDMRGFHVLSACRMARLRVPGQVSVIGVDNDPLLCSCTTPPLTSISPTHALEGRIAGEAIDRLMHGRAVGRGGLLLNTAKALVERESTGFVSPAASLIARAVAFIDAHAAENIKAADVVAGLGVSRSLLDMRMRAFRGETLSCAITARRLEEVARRLRQTGLSIRAISSACGFSNPNHLKNLFKRKYGMTMREWRSNNGKERSK